MTIDDVEGQCWLLLTDRASVASASDGTPIIWHRTPKRMDYERFIPVRIVRERTINELESRIADLESRLKPFGDAARRKGLGPIYDGTDYVMLAVKVDDWRRAGEVRQ